MQGLRQTVFDRRVGGWGRKFQANPPGLVSFISPTNPPPRNSVTSLPAVTALPGVPVGSYPKKGPKPKHSKRAQTHYLGKVTRRCFIAGSGCPDQKLR